MLNKHCKDAAVIAGVLSTVLLAGCKDDSLDLGDIDTTMKFEVKDLVLPLNLAPIEFDDVVDLTENECVEIIDGEYVIVKNGEFSSDPVIIKDINTAENPNSKEVSLGNPITGIATNTAIPLNDLKIPFSYEYDGVDSYIEEIYSGVVDITMTLSLSVNYTDGNKEPVSCDFTDMVFELPKGFYGSFDGKNITEKEQNYLQAAEDSKSAPGTYEVKYHISSFNATDAGAKFENHNFSVDDANIAIISGKIKCLENNGRPIEIASRLHYEPMHITCFDGRIQYTLKDLNPDDIMLNDLPDVLADPGTVISVLNPQLYLAVNNELYNSGAKAATGLNIKQIRNGEAVDQNQVTMVDSLIIEATEEVQNFCLTTNPEFNNFYGDYQNSEVKEVSGLGDILKGDGLPEGLKIDFTGACLPSQPVHDFMLSTEVGQVKGNYTFFAPLALGDGSRILYKDEATDWGLSSDSDELEISELTLTANCISELPISVNLHATPLNTDGEAIKDVKVNDVSIKAFSKDPIELHMSGNIKNLDGMRYVVTVSAGENTTALKPTMKLRLENLKIKVSGSYIVNED